jgi:predicted regulator of Ras-like GTPase activity (Roadblock/LC7/MglB family)
VTSHGSRRPDRGKPATRDQDESVFAAILADLVSRVPGARGAALVDAEGETVDYASAIRPFDLRLAAAHWRIVLDEVRAGDSLASTYCIIVRATRGSYIVQALPDGYALVVILSRAAGFSGFRRALTACERDLCDEAGWPKSARPRATTFPVRVEQDARGRPVALSIGGPTRSVEILGTHASGPARGEKAWRVRLDTGFETTLVRESGGHWYLDDVDAARVERVSGRAGPPATK